MDILIFALGTSPAKSSKDGLGKVGSPIEIGGATLSPGTWVYGDAGATLADMNPVCRVGMPSRTRQITRPSRATDGHHFMLPVALYLPPVPEMGMHAGGDFRRCSCGGVVTAILLRIP